MCRLSQQRWEARPLRLHTGVNDGDGVIASPFFAPDAYRALLPEELVGIVNGCGPGGWRVDLVPDSLAGLCITDECNLHDWMYAQGGTEEDRRFADVFLYCNLAHKILMAGGPLQAFRMAGAGIMYKAVRAGGSEFFGRGAV